MGTYTGIYHLLLYNIPQNLILVSMKNSMILLSCIFESAVCIHMHKSQTRNIRLWPKCPPLAFSVAEMSVAKLPEHQAH